MALRRLIELPGIADLEYKALLKSRMADLGAEAEFPEIDFSKIYRYETDDRTNAAQELACSAGVCEVEV